MSKIPDIYTLSKIYAKEFVDHIYTKNAYLTVSNYRRKNGSGFITIKVFKDNYFIDVFRRVEKSIKYYTNKKGYEHYDTSICFVDCILNNVTYNVYNHLKKKYEENRHKIKKINDNLLYVPFDLIEYLIYDNIINFLENGNFKIENGLKIIVPNFRVLHISDSILNLSYHYFSDNNTNKRSYFLLGIKLFHRIKFKKSNIINFIDIDKFKGKEFKDIFLLQDPSIFNHIRLIDDGNDKYYNFDNDIVEKIFDKCRYYHNALLFNYIAKFYNKNNITKELSELYFDFIRIEDVPLNLIKDITSKSYENTYKEDIIKEVEHIISKKLDFITSNKCKDDNIKKKVLSYYIKYNGEDKEENGSNTTTIKITPTKYDFRKLKKYRTHLKKIIEIFGDNNAIKEIVGYFKDDKWLLNDLWHIDRYNLHFIKKHRGFCRHLIPAILFLAEPELRNIEHIISDKECRQVLFKVLKRFRYDNFHDLVFYLHDVEIFKNILHLYYQLSPKSQTIDSDSHNIKILYSILEGIYNTFDKESKEFKEIIKMIKEWKNINNVDKLNKMLEFRLNYKQYNKYIKMFKGKFKDESHEKLIYFISKFISALRINKDFLEKITKKYNKKWFIDKTYETYIKNIGKIKVHFRGWDSLLSLIAPSEVNCCATISDSKFWKYFENEYTYNLIVEHENGKILIWSLLVWAKDNGKVSLVLDNIEAINNDNLRDHLSENFDQISMKIFEYLDEINQINPDINTNKYYIGVSYNDIEPPNYEPVDLSIERFNDFGYTDCFENSEVLLVDRDFVEIEKNVKKASNF